MNSVPIPYTPTEIKTIARILADLPAQSYLELCLTRDQFRYWGEQKEVALEIARNWKVLHTGSKEHSSSRRSDPFRQEMWLTTLMWQRLWEMIIACFPEFERIAALLKIPFPFSAPVELFNHILEKELNATFEICLQPYVEMSSSKMADCLKILSKNPSFDELIQKMDIPKEKQKLRQLNKRTKFFLSQTGGSNFWFDFVLLFSLVLSRYGRRNLFISSTFEAYKQSIANLAKLTVKQLHDIPSTCWHNGVKKQGNKDGTYSEHKTE